MKTPNKKKSAKGLLSPKELNRHARVYERLARKSARLWQQHKETVRRWLKLRSSYYSRDPKKRHADAKKIDANYQRHMRIMSELSTVEKQKKGLRKILK